MLRNCPHWENDRCSKGLYGGTPHRGVCELCLRGQAGSSKAITPAPLPYAQWPAWAKAAAALRSSQDAGVGDTIERVIGPIGGTAFKVWYRTLTGKECGCSGRQNLWNQLYAYASDQAILNA